MLKNILKLEGVQELSSSEQKNIKGSNSIPPICSGDCNPGDCENVNHLPICVKQKDLL